MNRTIRASHSKTVDEDAWIGQTVDSYRLVRRIGCGAMGVVYEAVHLNLGRHYALKLLHPHLNSNQQAVARFVAEGQTANRPAIPGVVAIHDVKRSKDGLTYILMEYLDGETLSARIAREFGRSESTAWSPVGPDLRPVPHSSYVNVSLMLARQIASTMDVIHKSGVVHRDLKPENIFVAKDPDAVGGERIKILDFGIAKVVDPASQTHNGPPTWAPTMQPTAVGTVLGTPAYMPPEQWYGSSQADSRSDVYACGAIFYELMSGRPPFTAAFIGELMEQHFYQNPDPLKDVAPWVSDGFASLVKEMMSKLPAERPTMADVVLRLQDLMREHRKRRGSGLSTLTEDPDGTIPSRKLDPGALWPHLQQQLRHRVVRWPRNALALLKWVSGLWWLRWGLLGACSMIAIGLAWWLIFAPIRKVTPVLIPGSSSGQSVTVSSSPVAKLYLYDPTSSSLDGLLNPYCETPCLVPIERLRSDTTIILYSEGFRSRTLSKEEQLRAVSDQRVSIELPKKMSLPTPTVKGKQCGPGKGRCQGR